MAKQVTAIKIPSKITKAESLRRLKVLRNYIARYVDHRRLKQDGWTCGTSYCAFGWATQIPQFKRLGLKLHIPNGQREWAWPVYGNKQDFDAANKFFGLSEFGTRYLFNSDRRTKRQWLQRCDRIIDLIERGVADLDDDTYEGHPVLSDKYLTKRAA